MCNEMPAGQASPWPPSALSGPRLHSQAPVCAVRPLSAQPSPCLRYQTLVCTASPVCAMRHPSGMCNEMPAEPTSPWPSSTLSGPRLHSHVPVGAIRLSSAQPALSAQSGTRLRRQVSSCSLHAIAKHQASRFSHTATLSILGDAEACGWAAFHLQCPLKQPRLLQCLSVV